MLAAPFTLSMTFFSVLPRRTSRGTPQESGPCGGNAKPPSRAGDRLPPLFLLECHLRQNGVTRGATIRAPGINQLPHIALFLPFSCNETRQVGASASKQNSPEAIEKMRTTGVYGESATTCKSLQNGSSQGSGPGRRWFESTRPDHLVFNILHIKPFTKSGR